VTLSTISGSAPFAVRPEERVPSPPPTPPVPEESLAALEIPEPSPRQAVVRDTPLMAAPSPAPPQRDPSLLGAFPSLPRVRLGTRWLNWVGIVMTLLGVSFLPEVRLRQCLDRSQGGLPSAPCSGSSPLAPWRAFPLARLEHPLPGPDRRRHRRSISVSSFLSRCTTLPIRPSPWCWRSW